MRDDSDLDLKSWGNVQDPFPLYGRLREHDPVHWSESLLLEQVTQPWPEVVRC